MGYSTCMTTQAENYGDMDYDIFMGEAPTAEAEARLAVHLSDIAAELEVQVARAEKREKCTRCQGTGFVRAYHYIENGRCFSCN